MANNHNPAIVRAMVILSQEVYTWKDRASGKICVEGREPTSEEGVNIEQIDSSTSILTLDTSMAERLGFAIMRDQVDFAEDWVECRRIDTAEIMHNAKEQRSRWAGQAQEDRNQKVVLERRGELMKQAERNAENERQRIEEERILEEARAREAQRIEYVKMKLSQIATAVAKIGVWSQEAHALGPSEYHDYEYDARTGRITRDSIAKWQSRTDNAVHAWRNVQARLRETANEIKKLGMENEMPALRADMEALNESAKLHIKYLIENR